MSRLDDVIEELQGAVETQGQLIEDLIELFNELKEVLEGQNEQSSK